jgi:hypothetical protein
MKYIRSFDPYIEKHRGPHNPRGIYVYKIRDLEAEINYKQGKLTQALQLAKRNFHDAQAGIYQIASARSQDYVSKDLYLQYLEKKIVLYEKN